MTREQKIEACTYCILHLVQYKPDWELKKKTDVDLKKEGEVMKRFTQGVSCLRLICCINDLNCFVPYLCRTGWVCVFYVGLRQDYETLFPCCNLK
jgi:hypothetical protein